MANAALQVKPKDFEPHTGIEKPQMDAISQVLREVLADSFTLYLKTLGVHWNVVGPSFFGLHKLTEEQYLDMGAAVDAIAERIRTLGHLAPASFGDYEKLSCIQSKDTIATTQAMIEALVKDNEAVARRLRDAISQADEGDDVVTADMLTARLGQHEKNVWMLKAVTT